MATAVQSESSAVPQRQDSPQKILAIDIGGSKLKILAAGQTEPRKARSGRALHPARMVQAVQELARDWEYEAVSIGYPGLVGDHGPRGEPGNLGPGWVGFDFAAAFGRPVRILNDAAMQALGSYEGGRMLFLSLGTGLGSTLIAERVIVPLELGQLRTAGGQTLGDTLGRKGLKRLGKSAWRRAVTETVATLMSACVADYVVLGGGNAKRLRELPPGSRRGHNLTAFRGGFRLWNVDDIPTQCTEGGQFCATPDPGPWRLI